LYYRLFFVLYLIDLIIIIVIQVGKHESREETLQKASFVFQIEFCSLNAFVPFQFIYIFK